MNLRKPALAIVLSLALSGMAHAADLVSATFTAEPFTSSFKALPGDASKPFFTVTAGQPKLEAGKLTLEASRFTIGAVPGADGKVAETSASARPAGVLDLSKPYKITVKIAEVASKIEGKDKFFIYVNNSTTKKDLSPEGEASVLASVPVGELKKGDNVFTGKLGDAKSFLQIRSESGAMVKIESISVESL